MANKIFFRGVEWIFAKALSFVLIVLGFTIFIIAKGGSLVLDLWNLLQFITIIWILYELFGFILFQIFRFFIRIYKPSQPETLVNTPKSEEKTTAN